MIVEGSDLAVFRRGDEVELQRISCEWRPSEALVTARAVVAIETATGRALRGGALD